MRGSTVAAPATPEWRKLSLSNNVIPTPTGATRKDRGRGLTACDTGWPEPMQIKRILSFLLLFTAVLALVSGAGPSGYLLVANKGDRTVGFVDPDSGKQIATVEEGGTTAHELIASPDGAGSSPRFTAI